MVENMRNLIHHRAWEPSASGCQLSNHHLLLFFAGFCFRLNRSLDCHDRIHHHRLLGHVAVLVVTSCYGDHSRQTHHYCPAGRPGLSAYEEVGLNLPCYCLVL